MTPKAGCPCEELHHPHEIENAPGLTSIAYRVGDYTTFREALLVPRDHEVALAGWHPTPGSDLGLQLLEWWAYLADILTFYNERALTEALLRTALLDDDVRRIVKLLGYRPRPGIGATGVVAAIAQSVDPFVVPHGFQIEGEAVQDSPAQIFEVDKDVDIGTIGTELSPAARFDPIAGAAGRVWAGKAGSDSNGHLRNSVDAKPTRVHVSGGPAGTLIKFALDGVLSTVKPGDVLVVMRRDWAGHVLDPLGYAVVVVKTVAPVWDEVGHAITSVEMLGAHDVPALDFDDIVILKSTKTSHLWLYHQRYPGTTSPDQIAASAVAQTVEAIFDPLGLFGGGIAGALKKPEDPRVIAGLQLLSAGAPHGVAHLEAVTRGIKPGDPVLFEKRTGGGISGLFDQLAQGLPPTVLAPMRAFVMQLVKVSGYAEDIWYGNAPAMDHIGFGPPVAPPTHGMLSGGEGAMPIPHSRITFDPNPFLDVMAMGDLDIDKIIIHYGWEEVGRVVPPPSGKTTKKIDVAPLDGVPPNAAVPVIVRDKNGRGTRGWLGRNGIEHDAELVPPLEALLNLLIVSRGQTVRDEILGSGNPIAILQEFVLSRSPLTYLADTGPRSTNGYRSTLRIRVDAVEWDEVPSFYGQPPDARVFVTFEDEQHKTHVRFGDGEHGSRLPAGVDNVVAEYRYGSGAATPAPGTLTSILRPIPGLTSIANPIPVGGGADPDPADRIRRLAPRSVLTFGRAVSGDDYEMLAAQTPGVSRAQAQWGWDPALQRSVVKVYVGDDPAAVANAREALRAFGDPNRHVEVIQARRIQIDVRVMLEVDPAHDPAAVRIATVAALLDSRAQPFGSEIIQIGKPIYDSQIVDACLHVPGVVAVHGLRFGIVPPPPPLTLVPLRLAPMILSVATPPPLPAPFGADFDPQQVFQPLVLGWRLGLSVEELSDPSRLARRIAVTPPPTPVPSPPVSLIRIDPGPRHVPGEGAFYMLDDGHLHVEAEVARHVL